MYKGVSATGVNNGNRQCRVWSSTALLNMIDILDDYPFSLTFCRSLIRGPAGKSQLKSVWKDLTVTFTHTTNPANARKVLSPVHVREGFMSALIL